MSYMDPTPSTATKTVEISDRRQTVAAMTEVTDRGM